MTESNVTILPKEGTCWHLWLFLNKWLQLLAVLKKLIYSLTCLSYRASSSLNCATYAVCFSQEHNYNSSKYFREDHYSFYFPFFYFIYLFFFNPLHLIQSSIIMFFSIWLYLVLGTVILEFISSVQAGFSSSSQSGRLSASPGYRGIGDACNALHHFRSFI